MASEMCIRDRRGRGCCLAGHQRRQSAVVAQAEQIMLLRLAPVAGHPPHPLAPLRSHHRPVGQGACLLYPSDAAGERSSVGLGGRRII